MHWGVCLAEGTASQKAYLFSLSVDADGFRIKAWPYETNFTTLPPPSRVVTVQSWGQNFPFAPNELFFIQIEISGQDLKTWKWSGSFTGRTYLWSYTTPASIGGSSAHMFTPTKIGLAGENRRAYSGVVEGNMTGICRWFRQTA
jgi:hypothetical protein